MLLTKYSMLKSFKYLLWYSLVIVIPFHLQVEISIRVISAHRDEQIKLTRPLEVGAGICLALKECPAREYGAAGRSNFQANRELRDVVFGCFCSGYGGETEENSPEYFIPTNRGSLLRVVTRPRSVPKWGVVKRIEQERQRTNQTVSKLSHFRYFPAHVLAIISL